MRTNDLTPRSRRRYGSIGAAVIACSLLTALLATRQTHPGAAYLKASFGRAGEGLDQHSTVKIRGVTVGGVASVELTPQGRALVTIRLDPGVKAPTDSVAAIMPLSIFGPKYIDLRPGPGESTGPYLADGATVRQTRDPEDLTDAAEPAKRLLQAIGPDDLATILSTLGKGLDGRGTELAGLVDDSSALLGLMVRRKRSIEGLLTDGTALTGTLAAHRDDVATTVRSLDALAPVIGDRPDEIDALLTGLTESTQILDEILSAHPKAIGNILDAVVPPFDALYRYRRYLPDLINGGIAVLTQLTGIVRVPGPHNTLLSRVTVHIDPSNVLCDTLPGVCGPIVPAIPDKPDPKKPSQKKPSPKKPNGGGR
ncbi:MCE family protein [Actinocorallia sp. A-T 12471]|uniref:MlaD family protein n=1 Tax=Actinocorallia sp. A-T 12471 TaxID=3089813 RepID=UPI0029CB0FB3|nr:MCE family protein [Actinocorallia sp. A-T 12471]MDX6741476.1 MCE family protein [Actinocorallia sp. A-T 12471]